MNQATTPTHVQQTQLQISSPTYSHLDFAEVFRLLHDNNQENIEELESLLNCALSQKNFKEDNIPNEHFEGAFKGDTSNTEKRKMNSIDGAKYREDLSRLAKLGRPTTKPKLSRLRQKINGKKVGRPPS